MDARKEFGATSMHKEHKQYSDLIAPVEDQLRNAEKLLEKPSYSDCVEAVRNLEILRDVIHDISSLSGHYANRQQLQKELKKAEERRRECEATQLPIFAGPPGRTGHDMAPALVLAIVTGYFVVGHIIGSHKDIWVIHFLLWPLTTGLPAVLDWLIVGKVDRILALLRAILLGLIPAAIVLVITAIVRIRDNARYNVRKTRYDKVQQRRKQLDDELAKLSTEISRATYGLDAVAHEISGHRHRIAQKIGELNWK